MLVAAYFYCPYRRDLIWSGSARRECEEVLALRYRLPESRGLRSDAILSVSTASYGVLPPFFNRSENKLLRYSNDRLSALLYFVVRPFGKLRAFGANKE